METGRRNTNLEYIVEILMVDRPQETYSTGQDQSLTVRPIKHFSGTKDKFPLEMKGA